MFARKVRIIMKSKQELIKMMQLAKLSVETEDVDYIYDGMTDIMNIIKVIDDVDISILNCEEEPVHAITRADELKPSLPVDLILSNAAERSDNFFTVRKQ